MKDQQKHMFAQLVVSARARALPFTNLERGGVKVLILSYLPREYSTLICSIRNLDICFVRLREHISSEGQCLGERKKISTSSIGVEFYWSYFYSRILCANAQ